MKKLLIALFLSITSLTFAQNLSVQSFYLAETDLTANTQGTMVHDQNGNLCALIKVETTYDDFTFDVGVLGVCDVRRVGGETWVYVPFGVRKITLSHPQLGVVRDYMFPCTIDKGRTYIMTLVAGNVRTIVEHAVTKQYLYVELEPKDAILELNGKIKVTDDGEYQELLPFGKYQYKAYCQDYHDLMGQVEISDPENTHSLTLRLKPAFGHVSISPFTRDLTGAQVYIDNKRVGSLPLNNVKVSSGSHTIRVIKELYLPYNGTFTIADEQSLKLSPELIPDFAEVTLTTMEGAMIYVNGELKGIRSWSGKLPCGSYNFESQKQGHIPYKMSYEITRNDNAGTIRIADPTPIYGSMSIESTPSKAKIFINNRETGVTPKFIGNQVIGTYSVKAELEGYKTQIQIIEVTEGEQASVSFVLEKKPVQTKPAATKPTSTYSGSGSSAYRPTGFGSNATSGSASYKSSATSSTGMNLDSSKKKKNNVGWTLDVGGFINILTEDNGEDSNFYTGEESSQAFGGINVLIGLGDNQNAFNFSAGASVGWSESYGTSLMVTAIPRWNYLKGDIGHMYIQPEIGYDFLIPGMVYGAAWGLGLMILGKVEVGYNYHAGLDCGMLRIGYIFDLSTFLKN